jgi:8-amino-7-oxononanoate synthase
VNGGACRALTRRATASNRAPMQADEFFRRELTRLEAEGLRRSLLAVDGAQDTHVRVDGRGVVCLCSNNYLGLANHPAVIEAASRAARDLGVGAGASRLVSGSMRVHHEFEDRIAAFKKTEAALLFNSGYHANIGVIAALAGEGDVVFSDALNHASLIDGCRLSRATVRVYRHCDAGHLEELLAVTPARRRLIVTDSIFSMDGDCAPLCEICSLADHFGALVMADEAHATGVVGPTGAGLAELLGVSDRVDVQMGTLGKALGSFGGYIAGSRALIDYLTNTVRTFIYATALPPPVVAAAGAALDIVIREPARRESVMRNARRLRSRLRDMGYTVPGGAGHIVPVMIGDAGATMRTAEELLQFGVLARGIRPPTVPSGTARIRAAVMATHTDADIDAAVAAFARATVAAHVPRWEKAPESPDKRDFAGGL